MLEYGQKGGSNMQSENNTLKCHVCGSPMEAFIYTESEQKQNEDNIRQGYLPALSHGCSNCGEVVGVFPSHIIDELMRSEK